MPKREDEKLVLDLVGQYGFGNDLPTLAASWSRFRRTRETTLWWEDVDDLRWYSCQIARYREGFFIKIMRYLDYAWDRWFDRDAYRKEERGGWRRIASGSTRQLEEHAQDYVNAGGPYGGPVSSSQSPPSFEALAPGAHHSIRARANSRKGLSYYRWRPDHWRDELTLVVWPHGRLQVRAHPDADKAQRFVRGLDGGVNPHKEELKAPLGHQPVGLIDFWRFTDGACFIAERAAPQSHKEFLLSPITSGLAAVFVYSTEMEKLRFHSVIAMPTDVIVRVTNNEFGYSEDERKLDATTRALLAPLRAMYGTLSLSSPAQTPEQPASVPAPVATNKAPTSVPSPAAPPKSVGKTPTAIGSSDEAALADVVERLFGFSNLASEDRAIIRVHVLKTPGRIPEKTKGRSVAADLFAAVLRSSADGRPSLDGTWKEWVPTLVAEGYLSKVPSSRAMQGALRGLGPLTPFFEQAQGKGNGYWIVPRDKIRKMPADFVAAVKAAEDAFAQRATETD